MRVKPLRVALPIGMILCAAWGCGSSNPPAAAPDPLADAPREWPAFEEWAVERLQTPPAAVPLPAEPALASPAYPLIRLHTRSVWRKAEVISDWKPSPADDRPLVELHNMRSDQAGPNSRANIVRIATEDGEDAVRLVMGGFNVKCEDVGAIELEARVPFGRHFRLQWGKAGSIIAPLASHDEPVKVTIVTDELAEWSGPLTTLALFTDGVGQGVVEVRSLRFMPRASTFPKAADAARVRLGPESRDSLYAHCPAELVFAGVELPAGAKLQTGLGFVAGESAGPVEFEVVVESSGGQETVLQKTVDAADRWIEGEASLASYAGRPVTLRLRARGPSGSVAVWGNPLLYEPVKGAPLVVLYLIDTLGAGHMDLYGYERGTTPRISELARQRGAWLSRMLANSSRTIESIPDIMFSMPTERHDVHHTATPALAGLTTLAECFQAAGYATVNYCTNVNAGPRQGMDQGFDHFYDQIGYYWTRDDRTIPIETALEFARVHGDRPVFMYVHVAEPHAPYAPPAGFAGKFDADYQGVVDGSYDPVRGFHSFIRNPREQSRDVQHVIALYDEEILYADSQFGKFVDGLSSQGQGDRADFFIIADHGEEFLQHGQWEHGLDLHHELTRVPLVAFGPRIAPRGAIDADAQLFDIMPTLLDMSGLPSPHEMAGASLWPLLSRDKRADPSTMQGRTIFASNHNYRVTNKLIEYSVTEPGRWKLMYAVMPPARQVKKREPQFLLYDLAQDPGEQQNVLDQHPDQARRLLESLVRWRVQQAPYSRTDDAMVFGAEQSRGLQAMGYLGGATPESEPESRPSESP